MKKYKEYERPKGACYDCLIPCDTFPDMLISSEMWEKINPTYHIGAGILCPTCIAKRLNEVKAGEVKCIIYAL